MRLFGLVEIGPRIAPHLFSVASAEFITLNNGEEPITQRVWVVGAVAMQGGEILHSTFGKKRRANIVGVVPETDSFESTTVTFGRTTADTVPHKTFIGLDNIYVSAHHAALLFTKGANPLVVDTQSKGGTFVNTPEFFTLNDLSSEWAPKSTDVYKAYEQALE